MARRRLAQPNVMKRSRRCKTAADDHALAGAEPVVAWRAEYLIALLAARQHLHGHLKGKSIGRLAVNFAAQQVGILFFVAACDRPLLDRARSHAVVKKVAGLQRSPVRLIRHLLPASTYRERQQQK